MSRQQQHRHQLPPSYATTTPVRDVQKQPPPLPVVDEETIKARAAAARAYALSATPEQHFQSPLVASRQQQQQQQQQQQLSSPAVPPYIPNIQDEDYAQFVKCLVDDDFFQSLPDEEDLDFQFLDSDEDDYDEDDEELEEEEELESPHPKKKRKTSIDDDDDDDDEPFTIETELGLLMEEDLEAAVTTLLGQPLPTTPDPKSIASVAATSSTTPKPTNNKKPSSSSLATVTSHQVSRLQLFLKRHHQLLVQQAVLCVRAAAQKLHSHHYESPDDLTEILDGAVGMLQDLDQNRKDAIRTSIQLQQANNNTNSTSTTTTTTLDEATTTTTAQQQQQQLQLQGEGRLTRAAFTKTLQKSDGGAASSTLFDISGLGNLKQTFAIIDDSKSIVKRPTALDACQRVLQGGSDWDPKWLPGAMETSTLLSSPREVFGPNFKPPCSKEEHLDQLRRDRNQFTAAEDSLVFRGVNLYGEKQWLLIADRYLPDRSVNIISQRYSKLSLLMYRAHGITIKENGDLIVPPKLESVDKESAERLSYLKKVDPPAILNVHRWSIEEDLTLLRAVPILGHMWAELSTRLIPHRDRGHLRKRYQVLERRVKATVARALKEPRKNKAAAADRHQPPQFLKKRSTQSPHRSSSSSYHADTTPPHVMRQSPITSNSKRRSSPSQSTMRQHHQHHHQHHNYHHATGRPLPNTASQYPYEHIQIVENQFEDPEGEDVSRIGVERILNDTATTNDFDEWSQMSRMKKVMEETSRDMPDNGDGVSRLVNVAAAAIAMERMDNAKNNKSNNNTVPSTGLDMLASGATNNFESPTTKNKQQPRGSILDSVLDRTNKRDNHRRAAAPAPGTPTSASSPMPRGVGYSPALHCDESLASLKSPGIGQESHHMWGNNNNSRDGFIENGDDTNNYDGYTMSQESRGGAADGYPTTTSTPSKQLYNLAAGGPTGFTPTQQQQQQPSELDAISALNSLSNSPARFGPPPDHTRNKNEAMGVVKRSLFDKVVKGADASRIKKRKL